MSSDQDEFDQAFGDHWQRIQRAIEAGDLSDAMDALHDVIADADDWCEENPSEYIQLCESAAECEESADWPEAESLCRQILSLPDREPHTQCGGHLKLMQLCRLLQRDSEALDHARQATAAAQELELPVLTSTTLQAEARCLIRCGRIIEAGEAVAAALSVIDDSKLYDAVRATGFTLRAECAIHNGELTAAERDLEQAFHLLQPLARIEIAAGIHGNLTHWWSVTAALRDARDDREGTVAAWREAVSIGRRVASLPHTENVYNKVIVADLLKGLSDALWACDCPDDALAASAEREEILHGVGLPEDEKQ